MYQNLPVQLLGAIAIRRIQQRQVHPQFLKIPGIYVIKYLRYSARCGANANLRLKKLKFSNSYAKLDRTLDNSYFLHSTKLVYRHHNIIVNFVLVTHQQNIHLKLQLPLEAVYKE